jgi:hypothetical protein
MDLAAMDPFTTVWRSHRSGWSKGAPPFHLTPDCPGLKAGGSTRRNKGRLGSMLAAGRRLCAYEVDS